MSKYRNTITLILSAISIMVSVAALCRTYPHTSDLGMDYQGGDSGDISVAGYGCHRFEHLYPCRFQKSHQRG